jgi:uncharacterized protein (TIGR03437 family)
MNSLGRSSDARVLRGRTFGLLRATLAMVLVWPGLALAGSEGLPIAHTGAFDEPTCGKAGCHRNTQGGEVQSVEIDVGPYVPGAGAQPVIVNIIDRGARAWGFQLTARRRSNPSQPAGTFQVPSGPTFVRVRCADTQLAPPCNPNVLQYVTQNRAGSERGPAAIMQFAVNWTAPSGDIGDVIFNVAAMGANGDKGTNGDHFALAEAISLYAPSNSPKLSTNGAVNAAAPSGSGRSIAPRALISIFGQKLAAPDTFRAVQSTDLDTQDRLPTELNRVSVEFTAPPTELVPRLGRMLFVGDKQINLQVPDFPANVDSVQMQAVINRGQGLNEIRSNVITSDLRPIAPALFTRDSSGTGAAAATHGNSGQLISPTNPARRGEIISVYGNGFGQTNPSFSPGQQPSSPANLVAGATAQIGGLNADVSYAGVAPGFVGLYQFNLQVHPNVQLGDQTIFIRTAGFSTQPGVTIRVGQ